MGRGITKQGIILLGILAAISALSFFVLAADGPYGVRSIDYITSSRADISSYAPANTSAEAGNVTELSMVAISTTKSWQGYYGNITGTLTLENSAGNVFYNWSAAEPKGEIYASINDTVVWDSIRCFEWEIGGTGQSFDMQHAEDWFGIPDDAADGLNDTYTQNGLDTDFATGTRHITAVSTAVGATCHTTNTYSNDGGAVADDFENVLLTDGDVLVFTTIIENNILDNETDPLGFDLVAHDFQLLVAENGQDGYETIPTTYFFWAEIQ